MGRNKQKTMSGLGHAHFRLKSDYKYIFGTLNRYRYVQCTIFRLCHFVVLSIQCTLLILQCLRTMHSIVHGIPIMHCVVEFDPGISSLRRTVNQ